MIIQINSDNHLTVSSEYREKIEEIVMAEADRFLEHLTRIEVYLSDQNSHKDNGADKRCNIEARLKGKQPIAVSDDGETYDIAINGAVGKLSTSLETIISKMQNH